MPKVYLEKDVKNHVRVENFLKNQKNTRVIEIEKYANVFNRRYQDFRVQKDNGPSFVLAKKRDNFVLSVPDCHSLSTKYNFYFSHFYNCPYDCEYCYLQGLYRSANWVWFVNYEDFESAIIEKISELNLETSGEKATFFSGYDADSLAMESVTGFAQHFIPFFETLENVQMELRTKSNFIAPFVSMMPVKNTFFTWTLSPKLVTENWEKGTASFEKRVEAIKLLLQKGWRVRIRIEPMVRFEDWKNHYAQMFEVFEDEAFQKLESIAFGHLRFPKEGFKKMKKMHPESKILNFLPHKRADGEYTYSIEQEDEMTKFFLLCLEKYFLKEKIFWYQSSDLSKNLCE